MKIDILCTDGSPLGVTLKDVFGEGKRGVGVGGAEYALLTMCEEWDRVGYDVTLYNNPTILEGSPFNQAPVAAFDPNGKRDIFIAFRSPNPKAIIANGMRVWWSCDQFTRGDFAVFAPYMHKIVCISDFHANYFESTYGITGTTVIDLPVRVRDFDGYSVPKVPNRLIFTSVPDRGLKILRGYWDDIKAEVPEASLVITSDYRLWGATELNEAHRLQWLGVKDVNFMGAISRRDLITQQLMADLMVYPCTYEELFCISVAEAQFAGVYPITSDCGALETTNMGVVLEGAQTHDFVDETIAHLGNKANLQEHQWHVMKLATKRFHPDTILKEWNEKVFGI
jgi:glycosyltransferase involved in cell wall biosynthesis